MPRYRERETGVVKSHSAVREIHNNVSFSTVVDTYADLGWDEIVDVPQPEASSIFKLVEEDEPVEISGKWTQVWVETDKFDNSGDSTKAEKEAAHQAELDTQAAVGARQTRDSKLADCDWMAIRASEGGTAVPSEWTSYRQQLRDIPAQEGFPDTINWPSEPS